MNKKTASKKVASKKNANKVGKKRGPYTKKSDWWAERKGLAPIAYNRTFAGSKPEKVVVDIASFDFGSTSMRYQEPTFDILFSFASAKSSTACYISFARYFIANNLRFSTVAFGVGPINRKPGLIAVFDSSAPYAKEDNWPLKTNSNTPNRLEVRSRALVITCIEALGLSLPADAPRKLKVWCSIKPIDIGSGEKHAYQVEIINSREVE